MSKIEVLIMDLVIVSSLVILATSCDSGAKERRAKHQRQNSNGVDMRYAGQVEGCREAIRVGSMNSIDFDLFCPKGYKDGTLNAGEDLYFRDKDGNMIILDANHTAPKDVKLYIKIHKATKADENKTYKWSK